ncbi:MAG TPA: LysR family transcriptional regulator [Hyphomicrobiaceae bacterium]|nr:LysR family transcriptional regulator [Hyphomicrobiaceae bacterium]
MTESLKDLRLFVAAYEERSFTAAAAREHATQSGVSQHIRKLEDHFRVPLFERVGTRIVPTPAAEAFYARCLDVLRAHQAARASISRFVGGLSGEISIGLMPTMTRSALAPALARYAAEHPNVTVRVVEAYSGVLTDQVLAGIHDFAIVPAVAGVRGVRIHPFIRTPEVLVSAPLSKLDHMQPVSLANLGPLKVVVPGPANTRRQTLESYFARSGATVERVMELDAMMGTLDLVSRTDWVTILPGVMMSSDVERRQLRINPLAAPPLSLELVLIEPARRVMSEAAKAFLTVLKEETIAVNACWSTVAEAAAHPPARRRKSRVR